MDEISMQVYNFDKFIVLKNSLNFYIISNFSKYLKV